MFEKAIIFFEKFKEKKHRSNMYYSIDSFLLCYQRAQLTKKKKKKTIFQIIYNNNKINDEENL